MSPNPDSRRRTLPLLLLCALLLPASVSAAESTGAVDDEAGGGGYLTFYLDNDLFGGTDRDYTNGLRLSWISEGEPLFNVFPARDVLEKIAGESGDYKLIRRISGFEEGSVRNRTLELNYGLSLTQQMFTPRDFASPTQPEGERRYAGWLGLGFSVHARDSRALNSVEVILGTTGENSLAEEAQNLIHDVRHIEKFEGWRDQIPNEVTLDLSFRQKRRATFLPEDSDGFSIDGLTEWGVRLGSFRTLASLGGFFRAGLHLPADFSDPRLSSTAYSHRYFEHGRRDARNWSAFSLFGFNVAGIGHDASLDGPLFSDFDTGNDREPWVGEVYAGLGIRWKLLEISYLHTWRTAEYEQQDDGFNFGSLAFRVRI
jgi:hypothetical protein